MKPLLAVICGFLISSAVFISGAAIATYLIVAEPVPKLDASQEMADRQFAASAQSAGPEIRRIPIPGHINPGYAEDATRASTTPADQEIDATRTGSIHVPPQAETTPPANTVAHLKWCSANYRSYRPETNNYTAYSGEVRPCVSPFSSTGQAISGNPEEQLQAASEGNALSAEHIRDCFSRYRSYRPQDNTYQPYGGGPRRQCR